MKIVSQSAIKAAEALNSGIRRALPNWGFASAHIPIQEAIDNETAPLVKMLKAAKDCIPPNKIQMHELIDQLLKEYDHQRFFQQRIQQRRNNPAQICLDRSSERLYPDPGDAN